MVSACGYSSLRRFSSSVVQNCFAVSSLRTCRSSTPQSLRFHVMVILSHEGETPSISTDLTNAFTAVSRFSKGSSSHASIRSGSKVAILYWYISSASSSSGVARSFSSCAFFSSSPWHFFAKNTRICSVFFIFGLVRVPMVSAHSFSASAICLRISFFFAAKSFSFCSIFSSQSSNPVQLLKRSKNRLRNTLSSKRMVNTFEPELIRLLRSTIL